MYASKIHVHVDKIESHQKSACSAPTCTSPCSQTCIGSKFVLFQEQRTKTQRYHSYSYNIRVYCSYTPTK